MYPLIHTGTVAVNHLIRTLTANHVVRSGTVSMGRLIRSRESLSLFRYGSGYLLQLLQNGFVIAVLGRIKSPIVPEYYFRRSIGHGPTAYPNNLRSRPTDTVYGYAYRLRLRLLSVGTVAVYGYGLRLHLRSTNMACDCSVHLR